MSTPLIGPYQPGARGVRQQGFSRNKTRADLMADPVLGPLLAIEPLSTEWRNLPHIIRLRLGQVRKDLEKDDVVNTFWGQQAVGSIRSFAKNGFDQWLAKDSSAVDIEGIRPSIDPQQQNGIGNLPLLLLAGAAAYFFLG